METETNPIIILLVLAASVAALGAWVLSMREQRRFRELVAWIESRHGARWAALPWHARRLNLVGAVERLRRQGLGEDPEFMARYRDAKRGGPWKVGLLLAGMLAIGVVLLGVRYLGWRW
jgi:hypothetical protein